MSRFVPAKTSQCFRKGKTLTGNKLALYLDFQFYLTFIKNKQVCGGKKIRFLSEQKIGPRFSLCYVRYIQGHVTALSYQYRLAIIYFWILLMISFNLIYDSLCHLRWYRSALFSHLARVESNFTFPLVSLYFALSLAGKTRTNQQQNQPKYALLARFANSDWFIALFASVVIGQSNNFGFGFTTLK